MCVLQLIGKCGLLPYKMSTKIRRNEAHNFATLTIPIESNFNKLPMENIQYSIRM